MQYTTTTHVIDGFDHLQEPALQHARKAVQVASVIESALLDVLEDLRTEEIESLKTRDELLA